MKKIKFLILLSTIFIIIVVGFIFQKISSSYLTSAKNISEIKLSLINTSEPNTYIFKEIESIENLLRINKELETFESEPMLMTQYIDINFEIIYNNGLKINKLHEDIRPLPDSLHELLDTVEARKQSIPLLYEDISKVDKLTLKAVYPKTDSIEITDKEIVDKILVNLKEYYLSDKAIAKDSLSHFMDIKVDMDIPGYYKIYFDNDELLKLLKEMEIYDNLAITTSDIKDLTLTKGNKSLEITDKEIIGIVMEKGYSGANAAAVNIQATLNTVDNAKIYGCFRENEVPIEIEKLFE